MIVDVAILFPSGLCQWHHKHNKGGCNIGMTVSVCPCVLMHPDYARLSTCPVPLHPDYFCPESILWTNQPLVCNRFKVANFFFSLSVYDRGLITTGLVGSVDQCECCWDCWFCCFPTVAGPCSGGGCQELHLQPPAQGHCTLRIIISITTTTTTIITIFTIMITVITGINHHHHY